MKITICGSIAFYNEMLEAQAALEDFGHEVKLPPQSIKDENGAVMSVQEYYDLRKAATTDTGWIWDRKAEAIAAHFEKVEWADAILVTNYDKNDISGYIGGNTLMEMGVAFFLRKPVYLLKQIPLLSYREEIIGMKPIVIEHDFARISV
ncbi:MAG: hypothetical protein Q8R39_02165 [bacterium]|nr:hypothetical protein [bacterium]MDZ4284199.1 hypothetical protein [Patescibacteria group bacterium]